MTGSVAFYLPGESDLARLRGLDPDAEPQEFQVGERAWILQTYLRLARAGLPVELTGTLPTSGAIVFHAKHKRRLFAERHALARAHLVVVRGDLRPALFADFEILQNGRFAADGWRFPVPHWPQPGLVKRDPARGDRLESVAYKGFAANLDASFRGEAWPARLAELGIGWSLDAVDFDRSRHRCTMLGWPRFDDVDVLLAIRPRDRRLHTAKPATKLINAWLAGVPAILGAEWACRELRRSELDYFEASTLEEAFGAVRRLRDEPGLFRAMVEHGRERAREFASDRLVEIWRRLLFEEIPAAAGRRRSRHSLAVRLVLGRLRRLWRLEPAR
ncbi:MAG: hypothetical protein IPJ17_18575 [Holophagales bacterium]|nr:MAG: hypothetical protein IPJ17_18575 [Holophagales bacterium]